MKSKTSKKEPELEENIVDNVASTLKSILGPIPIIGSFVSELVTSLIPDQRIDRLTKYASELNNKLSKIENGLLERLKENPEFVDLIEESFTQASRALTDERRSCISSVVEYGITEESVGFVESKHILKLLSEINDIELIWLKYYSLHATLEGGPYFEKHKNILTEVIHYSTIDRKINKEVALQESYTDHLERLGLIERLAKVDSKTKIPEYDSRGEIQRKKPRITNLGRLLLEYIGI